MNDINDKTIIKERIKKLGEQIALLTELRTKYLNKLKSLESDAASEHTGTACHDLSEDEKVVLFARYFRGREDVHSQLWMNRRTGKRGYSPVCKHEWARPLCNKPVIRCSECPNQAFLPFDQVVAKQHLDGSRVIGLYPMLKDENCYLLAIDFDKETWLKDVNALRETCVEEKVSMGVERSRSGNGGHVWIFFSEPIPAFLARRLGSYLITKTMTRRYQMDMKSYDRLFPSQDTMPKGGFGNLIALPFQKEALGSGNSVFIDEGGMPYQDQWSFLGSLRKMSRAEVLKITDEVTRKGQILDVRNSPTEEQDEPWMRLPSGKRRLKAEINDLPETIDAVLSNRIYIKTEKGPSALLNQLKHLAAFQNPEFYKKQKMRFSTHSTPRIISCAEITDGYLAIPRGCLEDAKTLLKEYGVKLNIEDKRIAGKKIKPKFHGVLNREQEAALAYILSEDFGVLVAPPGSGKTVLAIAAIAKRKTNVLILTHRKPLMEQWRLQLSSLLGIDKKEIGQIGGGKNKSNGFIDVAMVQSMDLSDGVDDRMADYGFIIVDECHHVSAFSFEKVLAQAKAKFVLGLTATPYRRDGHQPIIHMQCGPICHQIKQKDFSAHISSSVIIARMTNFSCEWNDNSKIHDVWNRLITDPERNQLIIRDIYDALEEGRFPLILTERREHLDTLEKSLKDKVEILVLLHGGLRPKGRQAMLDKLRLCPTNSRKVILATGSYLGEGFDEPRLDTLFLTMPSSFKGKIVQYVGRLHRYHVDKQDVRVYDYVDSNVSVLNAMHKKRLKTYKILGYTIKEQNPVLDPG